MSQYPDSKPMMDPVGKPNAVDELVVFQEYQTLPLFLVKLKSDAKFEKKKGDEKPEEITPSPSSTITKQTQQVSLSFFVNRSYH